jgi:hypothetical protein
MSQEQNPDFQILTQLVQSMLQMMGPAAPAVIPGALYTRKQIERNLSTGDKTVTWWKDNGLIAYKPATLSELFLGTDVIEFVKEHPDLRAPENYKQRIQQRKKGRKNGKEGT